MKPSFYEKVNPKTQKPIEFEKGTCGNCNRNNSQIFTKSLFYVY